MNRKPNNKIFDFGSACRVWINFWTLIVSIKAKVVYLSEMLLLSSVQYLLSQNDYISILCNLNEQWTCAFDMGQAREGDRWGGGGYGFWSSNQTIIAIIIIIDLSLRVVHPAFININITIPPYLSFEGLMYMYTCTCTRLLLPKTKI